MPFVKALRGEMPWLTTEHAITETGKEPAPRQEVGYRCPDGHTRTIPFAADVTPPDAWDCRRCGGVAVRDGAPQDAQPSTPGYTYAGEHAGAKIDVTPMGQLHKRRSKKQGEAILAERLAEVRADGRAR